MIEYKNISIEKRVPVSITCDKCKKKFDIEEDVMEVQEFHHINFTGGYGSAFGDMEHILCNICQDCLYELIKDFYRIEE